jgi:CRP/FNR family transcriptional regulator, cyclic AMP receptor protein
VRNALYLLGQLDEADLEWLIRQGNKENVAAGKTLIQAGRPISAVYLVLDGTLTVSLPGLRPKDYPKIGCGEFLGELSFVDARPPSATVTATEPAVVLTIPRAALAAKLEQDLPFAARFYRSLAMVLSHRLRALTVKLRRGDDGGQGDEEQEGELDPNVLDKVHLAGSRFERVLQRLLVGEAAGSPES